MAEAAATSEPNNNQIATLVASDDEVSDYGSDFEGESDQEPDMFQLQSAADDLIFD